jgi:hypothetical protein
VLDCSPSLDYNAGLFQNVSVRGAVCPDRLISSMGVLLPIALGVAPHCSLYAKPRIFARASSKLMNQCAFRAWSVGFPAREKSSVTPRVRSRRNEPMVRLQLIHVMSLAVVGI